MTFIISFKNKFWSVNLSYWTMIFKETKFSEIENYCFIHVNWNNSRICNRISKHQYKVRHLCKNSSQSEAKINT